MDTYQFKIKTQNTVARMQHSGIRE